MTTTTSNEQAKKSRLVCDICGDRIRPGERFSDDGSEIAHVACVRAWFRRNFGRESLS